MTTRSGGLLHHPAALNPREEYFRELIELHVNDPDPTPEQIDAVAARHDQVNLRDRDGFLAPGS